MCWGQEKKVWPDEVEEDVIRLEYYTGILEVGGRCYKEEDAVEEDVIRIPGELGNLTYLKQLYLGYFNVFEGGIPVEFGKLTSQNHLDFSICELDGPIPYQLGNLRLLDTMFLHGNLLSGSIPKELGELTSLVNLDLSNNALTGEIPFEFVNLKRLNLLNLFMNRLHGSIPDFVADLPNLDTLGLWMNNFTGVIPENLDFTEEFLVWFNSKSYY